MGRVSVEFDPYSQERWIFYQEEEEEEEYISDEELARILAAINSP